jgi:hypothetical protein
LTAVVGTALLLPGVLTNGSVVLPWFVPVCDVAAMLSMATTVVLGSLDTQLREDTRSLPIVVIATTASVLWLGHLVTFPGVFPTIVWPGFNDMTSWLFLIIALSTPLMLAVALTRRGRHIANPMRSVRRAWAAGAGPEDQPMTIDVDSTVCEVHGHHKGGAAYGHTRQLGLHPLLATRADTGEVLHVRQRKGSANTARGAVRFTSELVARVRRAGATGALTMRADSGFWSDRLIGTCRRLGVSFSITVRQIPQVKEAIARIPQGDWVGIDYTSGGVAQVAETTYKGDRLVVRRTRLIGPQAELWPDWRHHAFITDREGDAQALDADHRRHAVIELAIRDLKEGAGLNHCPSGRFFANAAWLVVAALAHNLLRWTASIGLGVDGPVVAKTIRRRFVAIGGRLTRSARRLHLHLPTRWPWRDAFLTAIVRLRALPLLA